jgi:MFS family permease
MIKLSHYKQQIGLLKISDFRNFTLGKLCLTFAVRTHTVLASWLVYDYTKSVLSLGLIGLFEAIPFIVCTIYGGYLADVLPRKKIITICSIAYSLCTIFQFLIAYHFQSVYATWGVMPVYLIIFFTGIIRGFYAPAHSSLVAQLISKEQYIYATTWNSLVYDISLVVGPALAGLVYGYFSATYAFAMVSVVCVFSILFFSKIKFIEIINQEIRNSSVLSNIKEGIVYVFKTQQLIGAFALDMFAVLFGGATALLPAFADTVLHCSTQQLGVLQSAISLGAIVMAMIIAGSPIKEKAGLKLLWSIAGFGVCMILFSLSYNFYLSFLLLFIAGMFDQISVIVRSTIVQYYAPNNIRGRVESVSKVFIGSSNEIGAFESGFAASLLGLVPSVIFGGLVTLSIVALSFKFLPKIKELEF